MSKMPSKKTLSIKPFLGRVTNGDCLEVMKKIPTGSVDTIVTDPP